MAYDPGAMEAALAAAVGEESALVGELRAAFFASADLHMAALGRASTMAEWSAAAIRLKSLAASFGALQVLDAAQHALAAPLGDARVTQRLARALAVLRAAADD